MGIGVLLVAAAIVAGPARAADGDTLVVDGTRVRLAGISAAELGTPEGEAAKAVMAGLVAGRHVVCEIRAWQKAKPPYPPRAVGSCAVDGRDLGAAMIEAGQATAGRPRVAGR